jgi:predicted DNA-binding transcriptional regulator YafY
MRYSRAERLIQLALEMQAARGGLTIADIEEKFDVSRRTAIRMRDAVFRAFPNASEVPTGERTKRWRLSRGAAQSFAEITPGDLASIEIAAAAMERANLPVHSQELRGIAAKIRNLIAGGALNHIEPDLEALTEAEGLAHRAGPRPHISPSIFYGLRTAIKSCRKVSFEYASRSGKSSTRRISFAQEPVQRLCYPAGKQWRDSVADLHILLRAVPQKCIVVGEGLQAGCLSHSERPALGGIGMDIVVAILRDVACNRR